METFKDRKGKYGRYLAVIKYHKDDEMILTNLNVELVGLKFAEAVDY